MKNNQETQRNVSPSEQEEDERGPMPRSAIKDLLKKWEAVRAMYQWSWGYDRGGQVKALIHQKLLGVRKKPAQGVQRVGLESEEDLLQTQVKEVAGAAAPERIKGC
ncbi:hypothetical protein TNCV_4642771 [Trichonephila clavipes]|nr:hypothetical protein TNCV_4642771 [Trichonephila clavipes]